MLRCLYVDNYRCLNEFELELEPVQLLIGGNGSGKSSVMDVLSALRSFVTGEAPASELFRTDTLSWQRDEGHQTFAVEVHLPAGIYTYRLELLHDRGRQWCGVNVEEARLDGRPLFTVVNGALVVSADPAAQESALRPPADVSAVPLLQGIVELNPLRRWLNEMVVLRLNPFSIRAISEREERHIATDGSNIASVLRWLAQQDPVEFGKLVEMLRPIIPGLLSLRMEEYGRSRALRAKLDGTPEARDIDLLSEGQRALMVLYALLAAARSRGPCLLFIDEPDNFLALPEIEPWLYEMRTGAQDGLYQLVISSHHPQIMNALAPDYATFLQRDGNGPTVAAKFQCDEDEPLTPAQLVAHGWANG